MNSEKIPSPAAQVLHFWFGDLEPDGRSDADHCKQWWTKDPAFDAKVRADFGWMHASLLASGTELPTWAAGREGLLSAVIVLDQFSRNMYRDTPGMFVADPRARAFAFEMIALGYDKQLPAAMRTFSYMPLMHSERLEDQARCVELFELFVEELKGELKEELSSNLKFAIAHRDIVARFGRVPHRNELLGRVSSEAELRFLEEPGSSF
jgi:uncharacterized protein (DUF924 family)